MQTKTQDIQSRASEALAKSAVRELRSLQVEEDDQTVELSGQVRSYYHKQLAQETIRGHAGTRQLITRVEVAR